MNSDDVKQSTELIIKHFGIESKEFFPENEQNFQFEELLKNFTRIISYLLEKDMTRLLNGLYRIDVNEEDFKKVLFESDSDKVAESVAKLIIERELKKVEFRKKYSS